MFDRIWTVAFVLLMFALITVGLLDLYTFVTTGKLEALVWSAILLGESAVLGWLRTSD